MLWEGHGKASLGFLANDKGPSCCHHFYNGGAQQGTDAGQFLGGVDTWANIGQGLLLTSPGTVVQSETLSTKSFPSPLLADLQYILVWT